MLKKKKYISILLIAMLAGFILQPASVRADLAHGTTVTSSTGSFYSAAYDGKQLVDGVVTTSATSSTIGPVWFLIDLARSLKVETLLVYGREGTYIFRMTGVIFSVGDSSDPLVHTPCQTSIPGDSSIFTCGLTGQYIGITKNDAEYIDIMEVRAYLWKNVAPDATTLDESGCLIDNCVEFGAINIAKTVTGWSLLDIIATKCSWTQASISPYFKYDLGAEKFIKAVVAGGIDWSISKDWIAYVGSNPTGLDASYTACVGATQGPGINEVSCNALGQFVIIQGQGTTSRYLALNMLAIFEGCDCAAVTQWPKSSQSFPRTVEVGQTLIFEQTPFSDLASLSKTPTCNFVEQCPQSLTVTDMAGDALGSGVTYTGTTLSFTPPTNDLVGVHSMRSTMTTHEGTSPDGVAFLDSVVVQENLQVTVFCKITAINHVSTPWSTISQYYMNTTPKTYALPTYATSDTRCQSSITYSLLQTNGQPAPSYLSIVGSDIVFDGGIEAEVLVPFSIKVVATDSVTGLTNEDFTFQHTLDRYCSSYQIVPQTIAGFSVNSGDSFTRTHQEYKDVKSENYGNGALLCGPISYELIDIATGVAPTFVTHSVNPSVANTYDIVATPVTQLYQVFDLQLIVTLQNQPIVRLEVPFQVTVNPCHTTTITASSAPADMEVVLQKGNVLQTVPNYDDSVSQTLRQGGFPSFTCGTFAYTLVDSTGAAPTFATVTTTGSQLTITGSEDATRVGPHVLTLRAALVSYPGVAPNESQFTLTMTDSCSTTTIIASSALEDMEVILQQGNVFQTIPSYDDQVTQTERQAGSPLRCGALTYTFVDSTGAAPTFAFLSISGVSLIVTGTEDAASLGPHVLTLRVALVDYPAIAPKESQFTLTMTDLCLSTAVIASSEPEDMEIGLGNGNAIQIIAPYEDQVSQDQRVSEGAVDCGPIVFTLEDADGQEPSICSLQIDEESSQAALVLGTDDEKEVGEYELSLVATLERYPEIGPMRSVFAATITPPLVLETLEEVVEEPVEEGTPSTLKSSPESLVQIIQGQSWRFVLSVSDLEDDFDREEVVVDGPAADAFTYDEGTKTLETKAGQKPAEQPLSMNDVKITLFDKAGNKKEYTFEVEIITQLQLVLQRQREALEREKKEAAAKAESAAEVKVDPPKLFAAEFTRTGGLKIGFDKALMIPDFIRQAAVTGQESEETKTESNSRRRRRRLMEKKKESEKEPEPTLSEKLRQYMKFEIIRGDEESSVPMEDLSFEIEVKAFEDEYMMLQAVFENPLMLSAGVVSDILRVSIIDTALFMDPLTGLTVEEGIQLEFEIPAQFSSEAAAKATESSLEFAANATKTSSILFVLVAIVLSVSMKQLWNLLNVIQIVAYLRIAVDWSANADMMMDYLEEAVTMRKTFRLAQGLFVTQLEEAKGSQDTMALYIFVFVILVFLAILYFASRYLVKKYPSLEEKREKLKRGLFFNSIIRYLLVSNLKLTHQSLSFFFVTFVYTQSEEVGGLEVVQAILYGLIYLGLVCWLFVMAFVIEKYRYELEGDNMMSKMGSLYQGIKVEERSERLYNVVFCFRRMCVVLIMLSLKDYHYFKIQGFIAVQTGYYIYIGWVQPHTEMLFNWLEIVNETLVMILSYTLFLATEYLDPSTRFLMGWATIAVTVAIFALNFGYLISLGIKALKFAYRVRQYEKKHGHVPNFVKKQREQKSGQMSEAAQQAAKEYVHPFEQIRLENQQRNAQRLDARGIPFAASEAQQQRLREDARRIERGLFGHSDHLENVKEEDESESDWDQESQQKPKLGLVKATSSHKEQMQKQVANRLAPERQAQGDQLLVNKQVQGRKASKVVKRLAKDEVLVENLEALGEKVTSGEQDVGQLLKQLWKEKPVKSSAKPLVGKFYHATGFFEVEPVVINLPQHSKKRSQTTTEPVEQDYDNESFVRKFDEHCKGIIPTGPTASSPTKLPPSTPTKLLDSETETKKSTPMKTAEVKVVSKVRKGKARKESQSKKVYQHRAKK